MSKRKHNTLNLEEKVKILKLIESGESFANIASKYGVGKSTVGDIKKTKILEYVSSGDKGVGSRKTLKLSAYPAMEKSLYTWFLQERSRELPYLETFYVKRRNSFTKKLLRKTTLKQVPDGSKNSKKDLEFVS
ncbi:hypothetical protein NQ314_002283 [Rhamnusium bicolor]|uniref:HTH psq-type domain-containing protein n=1 Tax=Rhamnusium bicolor TaxID=1586634 RepID=A0AAV8ZRW1_9CUCU|nr:hypothetical protein NQ314_002283 [Rhamnusium bicolor]